MFYGYPAALIAEWCSVAVSTTYAYKTGHLKPSKPAANLFRLHGDRMVLSGEDGMSRGARLWTQMAIRRLETSCTTTS